LGLFPPSPTRYQRAVATARMMPGRAEGKKEDEGFFFFYGDCCDCGFRRCLAAGLALLSLLSFLSGHDDDGFV